MNDQNLGQAKRRITNNLYLDTIFMEASNYSILAKLPWLAFRLSGFSICQLVFEAETYSGITVTESFTLLS